MVRNLAALGNSKPFKGLCHEIIRLLVFCLFFTPKGTDSGADKFLKKIRIREDNRLKSCCIFKVILDTSKNFWSDIG